MKTLTITPYIKDKNRLKNGKAEVYFKIRTDSKPVNFPTNCYVDVKRFEQTSKFTKGRLDQDETIAKDYLNGLVKKLNKIEESFIESNTPYTVEMIKNRIMEKDTESVSKGKTISDAFTFFTQYFNDLVAKGQRDENTLARYTSIEGHVKDFVKTKFKQKEYLLNNLDNKFQKDFHSYLVNKVDEEGEKLSQNTHIKYIQLFRKVIKVAFEEAGYLKQYPFINYSMEKEDEIPDSITLEQVQQIMAFDCGDKLHFQKSKDYFLFTCYTGLAFADLLTLEKEHIRNHNGDLYICKKRIKTGEDCIIFLQPEAIEIIKRYAGQSKNKELCFPYYSDNSVNTHIRTIAQKVGINKHVHFYMARHTYACISLLFKQSLQSIQKSLGHSSIKQTEHYARTLAPQILDEQKQIQGIFSRKAEQALKVA